MKNPNNFESALRQQRNEIEDYTIYTRLADLCEEEKNRMVLRKIAEEELRHYRFWKRITGRNLKPRAWVVRWYLLLATLFGIAFALKLLEKREEGAEAFYERLFATYPEAREIYVEERTHESRLLQMLEDRKLLYAGAVVLGMNDALVELTGTLTGVAFAFDKSLSVGVTGAIMGIAASLSMAGSAYLEARENPSPRIVPLRYALYTGVSYVLTTTLLVTPFFLFETIFPALAAMFTMAALSIVFYNFYIAVARDEPFFKRVREMALITFGVALVSFLIGRLAGEFFGVAL